MRYPDFHFIYIHKCNSFISYSYHSSYFYRNENEPQVRLRYSSQGTESNLVSVQRSTSLPAPFLSTQSSLVPADAQLSGSTNLSTPPFAHRSHSPQIPDDSIVEPQAQLLVDSVESPQLNEPGKKLKLRIQLASRIQLP